MVRIPLDSPLDHAVIQLVNARHEEQSRKNADSRADGSAHGSPGKALAPLPLPCRIQKQVRHKNTSRRIEDLFQNLGNRGLHHAPVSLKIPPQHAQNSAQEDSGGKNPERRDGIVNFHKEPRPEKYK